MTEKMQDKLVRLYDEGGPTAIFRFYADKKDTLWRECVDCEDVTPTFDNVCAVCFQPNEKENND
jgi:hypothetical protein